MNDFAEKRRFPRHSKKMELKFLYQGIYKDGIIQNLSLGGILFRTKSGVLINSPIQFVFELPIDNQLRRCVLHGKILRVEEDPFGFWPEVGCTFYFSSHESLKLLSEFLNCNADKNFNVPRDTKRRSSRIPLNKSLVVPTWWTHPDASLAEIKKEARNKKGLIDLLKNFFRKLVAN